MTDDLRARHRRRLSSGSASALGRSCPGCSSAWCEGAADQASKPITRPTKPEDGARLVVRRIYDFRTAIATCSPRRAERVAMQLAGQENAIGVRPPTSSAPDHTAAENNSRAAGTKQDSRSPRRGTGKRSNHSEKGGAARLNRGWRFCGLITLSCAPESTTSGIPGNRRPFFLPRFTNLRVFSLQG